MQRCVQFLRSWIPLFASFIECKSNHRKDALKEILLLLVLSLMPIWGGAILNVALHPEKNIGFFIAFNELIRNGELILYSTSILAPIFFLVLHEPEGERSYPEKYFQGFIILLILIISVLLFSAHRQTIENKYIFNWSVGIFIVSSFLLYLATVFKNWMNDSPDMKSSERDFLEEYNERKSQ